MATSKAYLEFISEQLSELGGIAHRMIMGEYIIYYHGKIAAYICDNRFFVKPVSSAIKIMPDAVYEPPYDGTKDMLLVENVDNRSFLKELFEKMYDELPEPRKKRNTMNKEIYLNNAKIQYDLQYKKVKNINLRIKTDGTIRVSADKRIPQKVIDEFLLSKADFITNALEKFRNRAETEQKQYFTEGEIRDVITGICERVYPYYKKLGIKYPQITFRKMVSRWGSCHPGKGILTFNINLMFAPPECIEYVVLHEFTHFLQANHSVRFYDELAKVCPEWKIYRKKLKEISIR